jgi:beta-N-acetylhexosaminidase
MASRLLLRQLGAMTGCLAVLVTTPVARTSAVAVTAFAPAAANPSVPAACAPLITVRGWSLSRLAAQVIAIPAQESDVGAALTEVRSGAGGLVLFGTTAPSTLGADLARLSQSALGGVKPLVMADEEGGAVQRMANLVGSIPAARTMGATMTAAQIQRLVTSVGRKLRAAGVTMDLAPVLDLDGGSGPNGTDAIGTRSFSLSPSVASRDGLAFAAGLKAAGVLATVKHFPGLGGASSNTDVRAATTRPWSTLTSRDLLPFEAAVRAHVPAIMVSNASVPGLTQRPASLSPTLITTVLRGRLGFTGLVVTDSLSAGAIRAAGYSIAGASVAAIKAGADMVMFNTGRPSSVAPLFRGAVSAVVNAVTNGQLSRSRLVNAVGHVLAAKRIAAGC